MFGPNGAEILPVIREWLNNIESAKLPRIPISSEIMSREAVIALEKAADVRNLALKKKGLPNESLIKIPGSALYRENSTSATDVMLASDHNDNEAPELGDRVVNLCASGIPFAARGTVVGIHKATTGCVEIVMDDEFIGGTNLQGLCSNFRGKLAVWAHLMRITVENKKEIIDKQFLQGSDKANVSRKISGIEGHVTTDVDVPDPLAPGKPEIKPRFHTSSPTRHGSSSKNRAPSSGKSRVESRGRAKQAGWREANGPPEKGIGFKGVRKGKSGINRWRELLNNKLEKNTSARGSPASHLKAMLGVNSISVPAAPKSSVSQQIGRAHV